MSLDQDFSTLMSQAADKVQQLEVMKIYPLDGKALAETVLSLVLVKFTLHDVIIKQVFLRHGAKHRFIPMRAAVNLLKGLGLEADQHLFDSDDASNQRKQSVDSDAWEHQKDRRLPNESHSAAMSMQGNPAEVDADALKVLKEGDIASHASNQFDAVKHELAHHENFNRLIRLAKRRGWANTRLSNSEYMCKLRWHQSSASGEYAEGYVYQNSQKRSVFKQLQSTLALQPPALLPLRRRMAQGRQRAPYLIQQNILQYAHLLDAKIAKTKPNRPQFFKFLVHGQPQNGLPAKQNTTTKLQNTARSGYDLAQEELVYLLMRVYQMVLDRQSAQENNQQYNAVLETLRTYFSAPDTLESELTL